MTSKKELYDDIYNVLKVNSGALSANDGIFTEILDFQIPRDYCIRVRKVIWTLSVLGGQKDQEWIRWIAAFVFDPDDETSVQIPTFAIDHDVLCDVEFEKHRQDEDTTPNGISALFTPRVEINFTEELDCITVRNARFNSMVTGSATGVTPTQIRCTVYFTYEKVSSSLYEKLLGIK